MLKDGGSNTESVASAVSDATEKRSSSVEQTKGAVLMTMKQAWEELPMIVGGAVLQRIVTCMLMQRVEERLMELNLHLKHVFQLFRHHIDPEAQMLGLSRVMKLRMTRQCA